MKLFKKLFIFVLIPLTLTLYLPRIASCRQLHRYAKAEVTEHAPVIRTSPEKEIPAPKEKKSSSWTWVLLIALVGGVAAAAGGGGGGGDSGGGSTPTTGSITGSW
jgi:hypothetical protein